MKRGVSSVEEVVSLKNVLVGFVFSITFQVLLPLYTM